MCRGRLVSGIVIIRAISRHPGDLTVNLVKQRGHLERIVGVLIGQGLRDNHAATCINRQM
jgi:hypothetical protein